MGDICPECGHDLDHTGERVYYCMNCGQVYIEKFGELVGVIVEEYKHDDSIGDACCDCGSCECGDNV